MKTVYLDQCHWIRLAAAAHSATDGKTNEVLDVLRYGVDQGLVSVPLSVAHYIETYRRHTSRHSLAKVMAEISRFHTIAGPWNVVPAELDAYLHDRYGKPFTPQPLRIFGRGWAFAFGQEPIPFKAPDDVLLTAGERSRLEQEAGDTLELRLLAGPPDGVPIPGWTENREYRDFGERQMAHEQVLAKALGEDGPPSTKKIRDWVAATEIMDIQEPLNQALARAGITAAESPELDMKEGLTELLGALPSRDVIFSLRRLRHADRAARWEPNDLNDLGSLSVALPYCDIVVTEKQWRHLAEQGRIPDRYDTVVLDNLGGLLKYLA